MANSRLRVSWLVAMLATNCALLDTLALAEELWFYCGTYTHKMGHVDGQAEGIGIFRLNTESGALRNVGSSPPIANSSHLCLGPHEKFLYAISEVSVVNGKLGGYLTVFSVNPATKALTEVQRVSSVGPGPAYVRLDRTGRYLLLANYVAGNVVVYPIQADGKLGPPAANEMHAGSGPNPARQEGPHPHAIVPSPDNRFVYVPDLGIDRIVVYEFAESTGRLKPRPDLDVTTPPGSGPRHFNFAPGGKYAFLALELSSEVAAYSYRDGRLLELGRYSTLPVDFAGSSTCAELRVSPDGKNVYVSNRGHDSIAVFQIDEDSGALERQQIVSTFGDTPRNFGISPDGFWVVAGNQDSHTMVSYRRDQQSGRLTSTGEKLVTPSPVIFYFFGARR